MAKRTTKTKPKAPKPDVSPAKQIRVSQAVMWLRCVFPTQYPIEVAFSTELERDLHGICWLEEVGKNKRKLEILITTRTNTEMAIYTLLHEWAHAIHLPVMLPGEDDHSGRFWEIYGSIDGAWLAFGAKASRELRID